MASNFLLKEENYRKINAELEVKTSELMKEFESIMKVKDRFTDSLGHQPSASCESASGRLSDGSVRRNSTTIVPPSFSAIRQTQSAVQHGQHRAPAVGRLGTSTKTADRIHRIDDGRGDGELLGADKCLGTEALISYLRANVKVLQEEVQGLQANCKARAEECREHQAQLKRAEEDGAKWRHLATTGKEQLRKLEHQCSVAATRQQQRETENVALRKEVESLRKELKTCTQAASSSDVRLNRCMEDIEKLKASVKQVKMEKKELQDESRKKTNELISVVKQLERQKMELISGFKKQMQLIDNLSRQKMQLEAGKVIQFTEREFLKLLESPTETEEKL